MLRINALLALCAPLVLIAGCKGDDGGSRDRAKPVEPHQVGEKDDRAPSAAELAAITKTDRPGLLDPGRGALPAESLTPSGDPECDALAAKAIGLLLEKTPATQRQKMRRMKNKLQNGVARKCADQKWSAGVRICVDRARDVHDLEACDPDKAR